jgi:hypothetical protein
LLFVRSFQNGVASSCIGVFRSGNQEWEHALSRGRQRG